MGQDDNTVQLDIVLFQLLDQPKMDNSTELKVNGSKQVEKVNQSNQVKNPLAPKVNNPLAARSNNPLTSKRPIDSKINVQQKQVEKQPSREDNQSPNKLSLREFEKQQQLQRQKILEYQMYTKNENKNQMSTPTGDNNEVVYIENLNDVLNQNNIKSQKLREIEERELDEVYFESKNQSILQKICFCTKRKSKKPSLIKQQN